MNTLVSTASAASLSPFELAVAKRQSETGKGVIFLLDCSVSMAEHVSIKLKGKINAERTRIDILRRTVASIRLAKPNAQMMAFGPAFFQPNGEFGFTKLLTKDEEVPPANGGGTPLGEAIRDASQTGCHRIVILSDGVPNSESLALQAASEHKGRIDTIYIGGDDPSDRGAQFLQELAAACGGVSGRDALTGGDKQLEGKIIGLLGDGSEVAPTIVL